jgi:membrane fusion protein (multidrug efflux system)
MRFPDAAVLAFFFMGLAAACHAGETALAVQEGPAIRVQTAAVVERLMPQHLVVTGSLRADQESNLAADANGKVLQVWVERGQVVHRGEVIATLDERSAALGASAARAQANMAASQLGQAQRECERVKHLLDTAAISQADFDRQTAQCVAQQWSAEAAEAQHKSAAKLLGDARIRAPFDGVIGERLVNVGQYVEPSTMVASIYVSDPLRLQITVPEANIASVRKDMPVSFTVAAYGEENFSASVRFISPNVREASRDLVVEALVANRDGRLRPGMFAVARLELGEKARPVVPLSAVSHDDSQARVFVVEPDKQIQERLVQLGETKDDAVAILNGLRSGEAVVTKPGSDVRDGARVE